MKKLILSLIITLMMLNINYTKSASYNFNFTGPNEATNGQTVTLTITGTGLTGKVTLSSTNATLSNSSVWIEKNSVNITAKITGFPAKITAVPSELTDNEYNIVDLASKTITINEKKQETGGNTTTGGNNNSGSNTGGSNNSGGSNTGSNTGSSSGTTSKPNTNNRPSTGGSSVQAPDQSVVSNETNLVTENIKSSNNYLKSITLSQGNLNPEFYREHFEYRVENLDENITELEVMAVAEDERASISGIGKIALNPGENIISIIVTAENGSAREYKVIVNTKENLEESDLRLQNLEINKINREGQFIPVDISFDRENFEYDINVEEDIQDLDINATVEKEGIIVEITGDKNLKSGENIVLITLTSQADTNIQTTYKIKVNKEYAVETLAEVVKVDETWKVILIYVLLAVLLAEIIGYIILSKRKK